MHLRAVGQELVVASHHRQRPFVASKIADLDRCNPRPVQLFGSEQVPDRCVIMTTQRQRLLDGNTQSIPAMAGTEFEQLDPLSRALGSAMAQVQLLPSLIERCWPAPRLPPLCQWSRSCQCTWLLAQHVQIVLQIEDLPLAAVAAFMSSHALASMP